MGGRAGATSTVGTGSDVRRDPQWSRSGSSLSTPVHRLALRSVMGAATIPANKLPSSFTSLYRLFIRASSASALHHRAATRNLRKLWKPTFREAAVVIHKLQSPTLEISERERLEKWRSVWELSSEFQIDILA